jgi:uncharacterized protein YneF (UPF0154 family)
MLIGLIKKEIDNNVNNYKSTLPPRIKRIIDNYDENVPLSEILTIEDQRFVYNKITEDQLRNDASLQERIVREQLASTGMSQKRIDNIVKSLVDTEELEDESIESLNQINETIKQKEEQSKINAKRELEIAEKTRLENLKNLEKEIYATSQIIPGVDLTEKEKKKVFESMTTPVDKDENGNLLNSVMVTQKKNPLAFEKLLHYYHTIGLFKLDKNGNPNPDFSVIKAGAKTSAISELDKILNEGTQPFSAGSPVREKPRTSDKMKENIDSMKILV